MTYLKKSFGLLFLLIISTSAFAQMPELPEQFDLAVFGQDLHASKIQVWLKENPGINNNWVKLDNGKTVTSTDDPFTTIIYQGLSTDKFAGQDLRENYVAIKIKTKGRRSAQIRAAYALPAIGQVMDRLHKAIQYHPTKIKEHSMGSLVFPRPQRVTNKKTFVQHIEMPVRHLKPGVQEVRWLDVIFSN